MNAALVIAVVWFVGVKKPASKESFTAGVVPTKSRTTFALVRLADSGVAPVRRSTSLPLIVGLLQVGGALTLLRSKLKLTPPLGLIVPTVKMPSGPLVPSGLTMPAPLTLLIAP